MRLPSKIAFWFQTLIVIGCFSALQAQTKPGTYSITEISGTVTWVNPKTQVEAPVTKSTKLPVGAVVKTGPNSSAMLVFANGSAVTLEPETTLAVTKFEQQMFDASALLDESLEPSISKTELTVQKGGLIGDVRKLREGSEYTVNSPLGAAGIRGTTFYFSINLATGQLIIKTLEGLVYYVGTDGRTAPIPEGMSMDDAARSPELRRITPDELTYLRNTLIRIISTRQSETVSVTQTREGDILTRTITIPDPDEISGSRP